MGISGGDVRSLAGLAVVMGGGAFALNRFAPIENDYHNGWPTGGPVEGGDVKLALGIGAAGLVMGAPMGLVGAAIADAPKSGLPFAMVAGAVAGAALGVGLVLGNAARD